MKRQTCKYITYLNVYHLVAMLLDELFTPPNKAQIEIIKEELKEDTERFENNLKFLEQWMNLQPHLPKNFDKHMLAIYLRGCKHDMEKTKKKLELFFVCRTTMPDLLSVAKYTNEEMHFFNNMTIITLPKLTQDGARIILLKMHDSNLELFNLNIMLRILWKIAQVRTCKEKMISGDYYIIDCANATPMHMSKIVNRQLQKSIFVGLNAYFTRIKRVYYINCPRYAERTLYFIKFLLKPKIRERVLADEGTACLLECFPTECLPSDYGGTEMSCDELSKNWQKCLEENEDWFIAFEQLKLVGPIPKDLKRRCNFDDEMQGRFRQLNLD